MVRRFDVVSSGTLWCSSALTRQGLSMTCGVFRGFSFFIYPLAFIVPSTTSPHRLAPRGLGNEREFSGKGIGGAGLCGMGTELAGTGSQSGAGDGVLGDWDRDWDGIGELEKGLDGD